MMRETGRRLLGIGARARFAAYSLFEKKSSGDSNFTPGTEKYILKSPDGALEVTVSDGRNSRVFQKSAIAQVRLHLTI